MGSPTRPRLKKEISKRMGDTQRQENGDLVVCHFSIVHVTLNTKKRSREKARTSSHVAVSLRWLDFGEFRRSLALLIIPAARWMAKKVNWQIFQEVSNQISIYFRRC